MRVEASLLGRLPRCVRVVVETAVAAVIFWTIFGASDRPFGVSCMLCVWCVSVSVGGGGVLVCPRPYPKTGRL